MCSLNRAVQPGKCDRSMPTGELLMAVSEAELAVTFLLESALGKDRILAIYLSESMCRLQYARSRRVRSTSTF